MWCGYSRRTARRTRTVTKGIGNSGNFETLGHLVGGQATTKEQGHYAFYLMKWVTKGVDRSQQRVVVVRDGLTQLHALYLGVM